MYIYHVTIAIGGAAAINMRTTHNLMNGQRYWIIFGQQW